MRYCTMNEMNVPNSKCTVVDNRYITHAPALSMEQMAGTRQVRMAASYTRSEPKIRSAFSGGYVSVSSQFILITDSAVVEVVEVVLKGFAAWVMVPVQ